MVLEKDGENHLDRSCEKRRSISYSLREEKDKSEGKTREKI